MKAKNDPSESKFHCPECNFLMPMDAPMGMCPKCLLAAGKTEHASDGYQQTTSFPFKEKFGEYELHEEVARGGMGVVYRATQKNLGREVALKMILSGQFASEREVERFIAEAESAAHLRHPHIVTVHEFGNHDGHDFYSMDFIRGCHLDQCLAKNNLSFRESISLLIKIARAVHFAHQRGVIHRDLKPHNILIDEHKEPKITDFGLAKRMDLKSELTLSGTIFGSPAYMAPEQAEGRHDDLGPHTDVYALGAILYRMLAGKALVEASNPLDALRQVVDSEPESLQTFNPNISPDLETICLKCLEKDPKKRYQTAEILADELERWRMHKPIIARRITPKERVAKWVRRNPVLSSMSLLVAVIGILGFVGVWWQLQQTKSALQKAKQLVVAEATARAVEMEPYLVLEHDGPAVTASFDQEGARVLTASHDGSARLWNAQSGEVIKRFENHNGVVGGAQFSPDQSKVLTFSFDTQFRYPHLSPTAQGLVTSRVPRFGDRTARIWDVNSGREISTLQHSDEVVDANFSPDGNRVITAAWDHQARIWDISTSKEVHVIDHHHSALLSACYSPTGKHVAITPSGYTYRFAIVPNGGGGTTSSVYENMVASIWNMQDGSLVSSVPNRSKQHFIFGRKRTSRSRAIFSPDGEYMVVAGADPSNLFIWNVNRGSLKKVLRGHEAEVMGARFSPDGSKVVSYSADSTARVWDVESGKEMAILSGHKETVLWAEFSPNGQWIVTSSGDKTARVWDAASGVGMSVMKWHSKMVYQARFSPDSLRVVTASEDGSVCLWDAASLSKLSKVLSGHESHVISISFSPDGQHLATSSKDGTARLWDIHHPETIAILKGYKQIQDDQVRDNALGDVLEVRFSPDGRHLVSSSEDSRALLRRVDRSQKPVGEDQLLAPFSPVRLWSVNQGAPLKKLEGMETGALASRFSPDGQKMLAIPDGEVRAAIRTKGLFSRGWSSNNRSRNGVFSIPVWNTSTGEIVFSIKNLKGRIHDANFSSDGKYIATAGIDSVTLWNAETGAFVRNFESLTNAEIIQFTPNSMFLLVKSGTGVGLWDVEAGNRIRKFEAPDIPFLKASLSQRGEHVIAWTSEGTVCVFETFTGKSIMQIQSETNQLRKAMVNSDVTLMATIGWDHLARIWDVKTGQLIQVCEGHTDTILNAAMSPDGNWLGTVSEDYTARLWPLNSIRLKIPNKVSEP